jgi:DNA repair protein RecN (Recombination protein N)
VAKTSDRKSVNAELDRLEGNARVEELARMLGGQEITAKTRAHAKELLAQAKNRA